MGWGRGEARARGCHGQGPRLSLDSMEGGEGRQRWGLDWGARGSQQQRWAGSGGVPAVGRGSVPPCSPSHPPPRAGSHRLRGRAGQARPQAAPRPLRQLLQRPAPRGGHGPGAQRHPAGHPVPDHRHGEHQHPASIGTPLSPSLAPLCPQHVPWHRAPGLCSAAGSCSSPGMMLSPTKQLRPYKASPAAQKSDQIS